MRVRGCRRALHLLLVPSGSFAASPMVAPARRFGRGRFAVLLRRPRLQHLVHGFCRGHGRVPLLHRGLLERAEDLHSRAARVAGVEQLVCVSLFQSPDSARVGGFSHGGARRIAGRDEPALLNLPAPTVGMFVPGLSAAAAHPVSVLTSVRNARFRPTSASTTPALRRPTRPSVSTTGPRS